MQSMHYRVLRIYWFVRVRAISVTFCQPQLGTYHGPELVSNTAQHAQALDVSEYSSCACT